MMEQHCSFFRKEMAFLVQLSLSRQGFWKPLIVPCMLPSVSHCFLTHEKKAYTLLCQYLAATFAEYVIGTTH
ncbi:hypothetical protein GLYMA_02G099700v4 [Glycine max]|uniref:Uncharacterized protein n=1 Tax=Glycine max TaxID=3847 RepID=K7K7G0_SOYBN|nr:hypothetical protein GYH30_003568 [Glycine max]KRH70607.1 hypothetical protein GLYMA_02G099700v4 [Glycine max]